MKYQRSREAITKKIRRHSGRYYPRPNTKDKETQAYIQEEYDDWENYRDGFRDWVGDGKKIINPKYVPSWAATRLRHMNMKNKRLLKRKRLMQNRNLYK